MKGDLDLNLALPYLTSTIGKPKVRVMEEISSFNSIKSLLVSHPDKKN